MDALKTPPNMAVAAHMAYKPGCMFQEGSHVISSRPQVPPKDPPTWHCTSCQNTDLERVSSQAKKEPSSLVKASHVFRHGASFEPETLQHQQSAK